VPKINSHKSNDLVGGFAGVLGALFWEPGGPRLAHFEGLVVTGTQADAGASGGRRRRACKRNNPYSCRSRGLLAKRNRHRETPDE